MSPRIWITPWYNITDLLNLMSLFIIVSYANALTCNSVKCVEVSKSWDMRACVEGRSINHVGLAGRWMHQPGSAEDVRAAPWCIIGLTLSLSPQDDLYVCCRCTQDTDARCHMDNTCSLSKYGLHTHRALRIIIHDCMFVFVCVCNSTWLAGSCAALTVSYYSPCKSSELIETNLCVCVCVYMYVCEPRLKIV